MPDVRSAGRPAFVPALALLAMMAGPAGADTAALEARIDALEKELGELRALVQAQKAEEAARSEEVEALKQEVTETRAAQSEWKSYDSAAHLAGYAAVGYANEETEDGRFNRVQFNPIFHFSFTDKLLLEAELETALEEDGGSEIGLEYATIDWILNDYATLLAGKFLSPVGQFQQNLHPDWVNKLPSRPAGFGHDQAIPLAEVGAQVRGGARLPVNRRVYANYALYVGNGPELDLNEDGDEIEAIEAEGFLRDVDDNFAYGGRLGILPLPGLELGISGAFGDVALAGESDRDYHVLGFDGAWLWRSLSLRGEYIRQVVGSEATSAAPDRQRFAAWYAQLAYRLLPTKFEAVVRYSDFDTTHADQMQEQWAIGINYLILPQAIARVAFELNDGARGTPLDNDRLLLQLTYGF